MKVEQPAFVAEDPMVFRLDTLSSPPVKTEVITDLFTKAGIVNYGDHAGDGTDTSYPAEYKWTNATDGIKEYPAATYDWIAATGFVNGVKYYVYGAAGQLYFFAVGGGVAFPYKTALDLAEPIEKRYARSDLQGLKEFIAATRGKGYRGMSADNKEIEDGGLKWKTYGNSGYKYAYYDKPGYETVYLYADGRFYCWERTSGSKDAVTSIISSARVAHAFNLHPKITMPDGLVAKAKAWFEVNEDISLDVWLKKQRHPEFMSRPKFIPAAAPVTGKGESSPSSWLVVILCLILVFWVLWSNSYGLRENYSAKFNSIRLNI